MNLFIRVDDLHPQMLYHLYDERPHVAAVHISRRIQEGQFMGEGGCRYPLSMSLTHCTMQTLYIQEDNESNFLRSFFVMIAIR